MVIILSTSSNALVPRKFFGDTQQPKLFKNVFCAPIYVIMKKNVPFELLSQWLYGHSCTWADDVRFHIAGTNEPKSAQKAKLEA